MSLDLFSRFIQPTILVFEMESVDGFRTPWLALVLALAVTEKCSACDQKRSGRDWKSLDCDQTDQSPWRLCFGSSLCCASELFLLVHTALHKQHCCFFTFGMYNFVHGIYNTILTEVAINQKRNAKTPQVCTLLQLYRRQRVQTNLSYMHKIAPHI